jgi:glycosyltransferase involved in cell wall biosynthesis
MINFYTFKTQEYWSPDTVKTYGSGASENALIKLSQELVKLGHDVSVYASCNGVFDGVHYIDNTLFKDDSDVLICSRTVKHITESKAKTKIFWAHDIDYNYNLSPEVVSNLNYIVCGTNWHCRYLKKAYPILSNCEIIDLNGCGESGDTTPDEIFTFDNNPTKLPKLVAIGLGVDSNLFIDTPKIKHSFIWTSMPLRGLLELLTFWPQVKEVWNDAILNVYYGWDVYDKLYNQSRHLKFKWQISNLVNRNRDVNWVGRIPQNELIRKFCESDVWCYPPNFFRETFCNSALEALAAKCKVISRDNGALAEVVGDRGILVSNNSKLERSDLIKADEIDVNKSSDWAHSNTWQEYAKKWNQVLVG